MSTIRKISLKDYQRMSYDDRERLPKKTREIFDQEDAIEILKEHFPPESTAKTILRHVSSSGMSRDISVVNQNCEDVTFYVARALGCKRNPKNGGIRRSGCGMDMGFDLIYSLSAKLYGHEGKGGYKIKQVWL